MIIIRSTQPQGRTITPVAAKNAPPVRVVSHGVGVKLKKLLSRIGIHPTSKCRCNARAAEMDRRGPDWCEENLETIVGWLGEEAKARSLPFIPAAGRQIVKIAIWQARKEIVKNAEISD